MSFDVAGRVMEMKIPGGWYSPKPGQERIMIDASKGLGRVIGNLIKAFGKK